MLSSVANRREAGTGGFALPGAGGCIAVCQEGLAVCRAVIILLDLLLEQSQIQLAQGIGTEAAAVELGVVANKRDTLQLIGDAVEGGGSDAVDAQSLEQQEGLEVGVGSAGIHEVDGEGAALVAPWVG